MDVAFAMGLKTFHCGHTGPITNKTDFGLCQDCIDAIPQLPVPYRLPVTHGRDQVFYARPRFRGRLGR